ncbi:hypothetical protein [Arthrobacter sp. AZCC_0090]|uniref:hypothetical protein n=1 Tax=Arthrobacter sp. AZCC_0090 TaxID=2735881 RepID=UPI0016119DE0|nr:hypothetical protein [Arthrobacter sp. AZCC_0090]MBB6406803.1 hypothetical protein [Arthrobacter sp. AZCC_0090]
MSVITAVDTSLPRPIVKAKPWWSAAASETALHVQDIGESGEHDSAPHSGTPTASVVRW